MPSQGTALLELKQSVEIGDALPESIVRRSSGTGGLHNGACHADAANPTPRKQPQDRAHAR
ncbi:hypothetical protein ALDI51_33090 [Alicycliphilus denitrificans]|nr:hypothetical protein ALDI51_33090 [Alicycliphilus denitrificans]